MWLRNSVIVLGLMALAGCGFQPVYGQKQTRSGQVILPASIAVDPIAERLGQMYFIALEDGLNPSGAVPANPDYRLHATIIRSESATDVARDGTIQRSNIYLTSQYILRRASDNAPLTRGRVRHVSSYNNQISAYYSTYVSREDAIARGVAELSERVRQRLAAYLSGPEAGMPDSSIGQKEEPEGDPVNPQTIPTLLPADPTFHRGSSGLFNPRFE